MKTITREEIFKEALNKFQEQFKCKLKFTGYENSYEENDGIGEEEYWIEGVIISKVELLHIEIGGWFSHDTRDKEDTIYCLLILKLNDKIIGDCQGIQSWYDVEKEEWSNLVWESY